MNTTTSGWTKVVAGPKRGEIVEHASVAEAKRAARDVVAAHPRGVCGVHVYDADPRNPSSRIVIRLG